MSTNHLYSLTWGEYGTSLISAVQLLRCHGDLVDVTLAAGGRCFPAHKIVLCAASPFLLDLLKSTPCKHPVVMLAGVNAADLEALLEFVYRGEVSIDPTQLPSLLQAAHCLNIQGLAPAPAATSGNDTTHHNTLQNTIKAVLDMAKTDETLNETGTTTTTTTTETTQDVLSRDIINSYLPLRRRKRFKRKPTILTSRTKWPRQNLNENTENRTMIQPNPPVTEPWPEPNLHFQTSDQLLASHSSDTGTNISNVSVSKGRSASDQPGTCPLCGAMLRQARNLRRHLLTSCKYRDTADTLHTLTAAATEHRLVQHGASSREPNLHQMQSIASTSQAQVQSEHLENKTSVLTHIPCGNIGVPE